MNYKPDSNPDDIVKMLLKWAATDVDPSALVEHGECTSPAVPENMGRFCQQYAIRITLLKNDWWPACDDEEEEDDEK